MSDTATKTRTKSAKKWKLWIEISGKVYKGGRKYLEDYMSAKIDLKTRSSFLAVFDGHCGKEAAEFACENLWEAIMNSEGFGNKDSVKVVEAIKAGFFKTHEAMWKVRRKSHNSRVYKAVCKQWTGQFNVVQGSEALVYL